MIGVRVPTMSPLATCAWILGGVCAVVWILSLITNEHSWVDRIWSIIPIPYVAVFAGGAGFRDARLDVMLGLVTLWGARLTFNFARKGGYAPGGEDYRWEVLRSRMPAWRFQVFNLAFITIYQNVLLLLITLPAYTALRHPGGFGPLDVLATVLFLVLLTGETVADQQQWNFHAWKRAEVAAGREPRPGFNRTGMWRYSRHPNFFCEQAQWWVLFGFGAIAAGSVLQPTVVGALLLTLLFIGSTRFTESITASKYPEYADYRATTSAQIPWFPRRGRESALPAA
jgi:steroid 5-alpha reductase family enzyme